MEASSLHSVLWADVKEERMASRSATLMVNVTTRRESCDTLCEVASIVLHCEATWTVPVLVLPRDKTRMCLSIQLARRRSWRPYPLDAPVMNTDFGVYFAEADSREERWFKQRNEKGQRKGQS